MSEERDFPTLAPEALAPAQLLRTLDRGARKALGQNFLAGKSALRRILLALDLQPGDVVVEIGAGLGTLTGFLAATAREVVAVELDDDLAHYLAERFRPVGTVRLVHGDILDLTPADLLTDTGEPYKVVGNLPYYITSAAIRHVLSWEPTPQVIVVMVQEEVARRIVAKPGDLSLLALMVQLRARAEMVARVPAGAFVPRPKVDSAVVRIVPDPARRLEPEVEEHLFELARAGFQQKRKTLVNSLAGVAGMAREDLAQLLQDLGINPSARAQELSPDQWIALARAIRPEPGGAHA
ncbi:MAG: 16S rRNA (adenine(1518)-N(6)/adenine(1519)-N(6))-dimethyltransferase RsmA [Anaerolineae bacterium]